VYLRVGEAGWYEPFCSTCAIAQGMLLDGGDNPSLLCAVGSHASFAIKALSLESVTTVRIAALDC